MPTKLCLFCKRFLFDMGQPDYSKLTLGDPASIECSKQYWRMSYDSTRAEYRKAMQTAETCPDYIQVKLD